MLPMLALVFLASAFCPASPPRARNEAPDYKLLYESHLWFELRKAVQHHEAPLFYRAVIESVFGKSALAEKNLRLVIKSAAGSEMAYEARNALTSLFLRAGRYRDAWLENSQLMKERPDQGDVQEMGALLDVLSKYPDQMIVARRPSTLRYELIQGNIFVPVTIHSQKAQYMLDTAATLSTISESEAKRLNLAIHTVSSTADTGTGARIGVQVAMAKQFTIGEIHLRNVAFLVVPDGQPPFADLPTGQKGIIGLPVLLGLRNISWQSGGQMRISFPVASRPSQEPNVCFEDITLITNAKFGQKSIPSVLDTGAIHSQLWPIFAKTFPELLKHGKYESSQVIGIAGSRQFPVVVLPSISLAIGEKDIAMAPAFVLLSQDADLASFYYGDIGVDLLNEAKQVTIDFSAMHLSLQ